MPGIPRIGLEHSITPPTPPQETGAGNPNPERKQPLRNPKSQEIGINNASTSPAQSETSDLGKYFDMKM